METGLPPHVSCQDFCAKISDEVGSTPYSNNDPTHQLLHCQTQTSTRRPDPKQPQPTGCGLAPAAPAPLAQRPADPPDCAKKKPTTRHQDRNKHTLRTRNPPPRSSNSPAKSGPMYSSSPSPHTRIAPKSAIRIPGCPDATRHHFPTTARATTTTAARTRHYSVPVASSTMRRPSYRCLSTPIRCATRAFMSSRSHCPPSPLPTSNT